MDTFASGGPVWPQGCDVALPPREHNRDVLYNLYEVSKCSRVSLPAIVAVGSLGTDGTKQQMSTCGVVCRRFGADIFRLTLAGAIERPLLYSLRCDSGTRGTRG